MGRRKLAHARAIRTTETNMTEITLQFIGERLAAIQGEQSNIRIDLGDLKKAIADLNDDMKVLTAIVLRLDGSTGREFRSIHEQMGRLAERVRQLETH
jgi:hypothetical protein